MGFWSSLKASTDSASAFNQVGAGLEKTKNGAYELADPTASYFQLTADGSSRYLRIDLVDMPVHDRREGDDGAQAKALEQVNVRVDVNGHVGRSRSVYVGSPRSLYLDLGSLDTSGASSVRGVPVRIWVQEPKGSIIPFLAVRSNVHVPFHFSWLRVAAMMAAVALVVAWQPRSRLWSTRLDPGNTRQRWALAAALSPFAIICVITLVQQVRYPMSLVFHSPDGYMYDFDQYGHVADALLQGHPWLDLHVPDALQQLSNPYSPAQRERLLADGVSPIYWDYVYYQGHWYSYFGVVPAVLLFLPFRLVTSLWVDGGIMMSSTTAVIMLMFGFLIFGCLLIVRIISGISDHASLATTSMVIILFMIGSNATYLWFRSNFYSIPIAASLMFSCMGLWFWLGADHRSGSGDADGNAGRGSAISTTLSVPHLIAGSLCMAANVGCRPNMTLAALLALPIFWHRIRPWIIRITQIARRPRITRPTSPLPTKSHGSAPTGIDHAGSPCEAVRFFAGLLLPALIVVIALFWYNIARFGSPLDFGNRYQITVTDMTHYVEPLANIVPMLGYYLFLPLRFVDSFPYLATNPTPLPLWGYRESMVAGLFVACPLALLSLAIPWLRRYIRSRSYWPFLCSCLLLGCALLVFDVVIGGLGWRYIADFGWLITLAAIPGILTIAGETMASSSPANGMPSPRLARLVSIGRSALMVLMLVTLCIAVATAFVPGRDDALVRNDPGIFYEVRSWFELLPTR